MVKVPLYSEIAESIRQQVLYGSLQPDDTLPTVRQMADTWQCAPGTVLHAYKELAEQGLVVSRPGAGTQIASGALTAPSTPLRRMALVNQVEAFLLGVVTSGHSVREVESAFQMALDRYRTLDNEPVPSTKHKLNFVGSHDPVISILTARLAQQNPKHEIQLTFDGSLGGLIALARKKAQIAGAHLWDSETNHYNHPFVRRLLPGQRIALINLAHRRVGFMTANSNPLNIYDFLDLVRSDVRFINRQEGAGTRVWLDEKLRALSIDPDLITGYQDEVRTHVEVASAIHEQRADIGVGIESAALAYALNFIFLTTERYDLVIPESVWGNDTIQALVATLQEASMKSAIDRLGGYETTNTGDVEWVN